MKRTHVLLAILAALIYPAIQTNGAVLSHHVGVGARQLADKLDPSPCNPRYVLYQLDDPHQLIFDGWVSGKPLTVDASRAYGADMSLRYLERTLRECVRR